MIKKPNIDHTKQSLSQEQRPARSLGDLPHRLKARISGFHHQAISAGSILSPGELERRLVEMGFVEGATVRIEHRGGLRGDPIGVRIDGRRLVALRRQEAFFIAVEELGAVAG